MKEKVKTAPKELVHSGLDDGIERLRGQIRETTQQGQASDYGGDQIEDTAANGTRQAMRGTRTVLKREGGARERKPYGGPHSAPGASVQESPAEQPHIKTREAVRHNALSDIEPSKQVKPGRHTIGTKETAIHDTRVVVEQVPRSKTALPEIKTKDAYIQKQTAAEAKQPSRQGQQKTSQAVTMKRRKAQQMQSDIAPHAGSSRDAASPAPARCRYSGGQNKYAQARTMYGLVRSNHSDVRPTENSGRALVKTARAGRRTAEHSVRQTIKTAETTSRKTVKTSQRSVKTARQTAQANARAARRAVQTARATAKAAKATVKATITAVKAAIAAIKSLIAAIAAGGWVAVVIILVICLVALVLFSVYGIFFSDESNDPNAISPSAAVAQLNREYADTLSGYETGGSYDSVEIIGRPPSWVDVFAVFSVKTVTGDHMDVVVLDAERIERLRTVFWDMTKITTETRTVNHPAEGDTAAWTETVLVITVTPRTPDDMRTLYQFTGQQNKALDELLAEENRALWNDLLYGSSGEIVAVALSQVGNVGGQPYWSWYGFSSHVDWCACFVSWCADRCGYIDAGIVPKFASCSAGAQWFKARGLWQDNSYVPSPGDLAFFDWDKEGKGQDGAMDHVGIVERVEGGMIYTIEGNSGDACRQRSYPVGHYEIYGFATLAFN